MTEIKKNISEEKDIEKSIEIADEPKKVKETKKTEKTFAEKSAEAAATAALKAGAFDFLTKPLDLDHLNKIVKNALHGKILAEQNRELKEKL